MAQINYQEAKDLLYSLYKQVVENVTAEVQMALTVNAEALDIIFSSKTQSYREVLLGCALMHLIEPARH